MSRRKRMLEQLDQDILDHIDRETQDNMERGMSPEEARYAAVRKFGNVTRVKEETHEVWTSVWLEQLLQDEFTLLKTLKASARNWMRCPSHGNMNTFDTVISVLNSDARRIAARVPVCPGSSSAKEFAALVFAKMLGFPFWSICTPVLTGCVRMASELSQ
jgi:hypothetical protein